MASFEKLSVYQKSIEFALSIYQLTKHWPKEELFGLTSQIRRAAVSIALNIAEGSSRTNKDFIHFLSIARGSCYECIPLLTMANKIDLLTNNDYRKLYMNVEELSKMINGLRSSLMTKKL